MKEGKTLNIKIIDMPMGTGKTTGIINYMNSHPEKRYMFITPFLDEVQRIISCCPSLRFEEPSDRYSKLNSLKELIAEDKNIVSTHALFSIIDTKVLELLEASEYILILDEVMEVIEPLRTRARDIEAMIKANIITVGENGLCSAEDRSYRNRGYDFSYAVSEIRNQNVYLVDYTVLLCLFNSKTFGCFEDCIVLTYMFDGSLMKSYLELFRLDYSFYRIKNDSIIEGKYDDSPFVTQVKNLINIYEGRLNNVGESENALSSSWFRSRAQNDNKNILRKNMYNYLHYNVHSNAATAMWTTFLGVKGRNKEKMQPRDYKRNTFVPCNARATNQYSGKVNLVYAVNVYMNPYISRYLHKSGVNIDEDRYALAQMLQWIWRSRIRNGYGINIYIPSSRMRRLLLGWLKK